VHRFGRQARRIVEEARETIAALTGAAPAGIIFTSGGTEANVTLLKGLPHRPLLASAVEHPSILSVGVDHIVPVDGRGLVDLDALERLLAADPRPALVAVMLANNETGAIQPLPAVAELGRAYGAWIHCDAVQAAGKMPIEITALGVQSLALSAHKLGGPQGVGALVLADGEAALTPLLPGGGQERRRRSGTENVPGIAGFAAAVRALGDIAAEATRLTALRDRLERDCRQAIPSLVVLAEAAERLPNTSCLAVPGLAAQTLLMALDLAGVAVSAGSACSSGKLTPSPVLAAMGEPALAAAAIRVSMGWASTGADVDRFVDRFTAIVADLGRGHRAA
jgi:cysteine desulfurase